MGPVKPAIMKDSIGTEIPVQELRNADQTTFASGVNFTFILVCQVALSQGHMVIYSPESKSAAITSENGTTLIAQHV